MQYRITCENIKSGVKETIETDNVLIVHSHENPEGNLSWSVSPTHIQPAALAWLLKQPAIQNLLTKLDLNSLLGTFLNSKFGGHK